MLRSAALRVSILVLIAVYGLVGNANAQTCQAKFEPRNVSGKPGEAVTVTITPTTVPEGSVAVAFSVDPMSIIGRGISVPEPFVISNGVASGFEPVPMTLYVDPGAQGGQVPITIKAEPLAEGQMPGSGAAIPVTLPNAFTISIASQTPDFDFFVGLTTTTAPTPGGTMVSMPAPGREKLKLVAIGKNGFHGPVTVSKSTTSDALWVVSKDCPPEGGPQCMFETLTINIGEQGVGFEEVILSTTPAATGGQVMFHANHDGIAPKQAMVNVNIKAGAPAPPPGFELQLPPAVDLKAGDTFQIPVAPKGKNGFAGPIDVKITPPAGVSIEPPQFQVHTDQQTVVTLRVDPNAQPLPPGADILYLSAQGYANAGQLLMKQAQVKVRITPNAPPLPVGDFNVFIGTHTLQMGAPARERIQITVRGENGFRGGVVVRPSTSRPDLKIYRPDCPPNGGDECRFESQWLEIGPTGQAVTEAFVVAEAGANNGQVTVTASHEGIPEKQAVMGVNIQYVVAPPPPNAEFRLEISPAELILEPGGEEKEVTITIKRPPGYDGLAQVNHKSGDKFGLSYAPSDTVGFGVGEATKTYRVKAEPHFRNENGVTLEYEAMMYNTTYTARGTIIIRTPKQGLQLRAVANQSDVLPGGTVSIAVSVARAEGINTPIELAIPMGSDIASTVIGDPLVPPFNGSTTINLQVAPNAQPGQKTATINYRAGNYSDSLPVSFRVIQPDATIRIEPERLELLAGEQKSIRVFVEGKHGWTGPATVRLRGSNGTSAEPESVEMTLPGQHEFTIKAAPNAEPNNYAGVKVQVRPSAYDSVIEEATLMSSIVARPAEYQVAAIPSRLDIQTGSFEMFSVHIQRQNGWEGPIDVSISGNDKVDVTPNTTRIAAGQNNLEVKVTPKPGAQPTAGSESSLIIKTTHAGTSAREAYVALGIKAPPVMTPTPANPSFTIASRVPKFEIYGSEEATFEIFVNGLDGWNGPVQVTVREEDGHANELRIEPSSFVLETGNPSLESKQVLVTLGPSHGPYDGGMGFAIPWRVHKVRIEARPLNGGETKSMLVDTTAYLSRRAPKLHFVEPLPRRVNVPFNGDAVSLQIGPVASATAWSGVVRVDFEHPGPLKVDPQSLTISVGDFRNAGARFGTVTLYSDHEMPFGPTAPLVVKLTAVEGYPDRFEIPIMIGRAGRGGVPGRGDEVGSPLVPVEPPPMPMPAPMPMPNSDMVGADRFRAYRAAQDLRREFDGIVGEAGDENERILNGFLQAYEKLMVELRAAPPLVAWNADDAAVLASMLEQHESALRAHPEYDVASMTPLLAASRAGQPRRIQGDPLRMLLHKVKKGHELKQFATWSEIVDGVFSDMNGAVENLKLDKAPIPHVQVAAKGLALTAAASSAANLAIQAATLAVPNHISDCYATLGGAGDTGIKSHLWVGAEEYVNVYLVGSNDAKEIGTPFQVAKKLGEMLWAKYGSKIGGKKGDSDRNDKGKKKTPAEDEAEEVWSSQAALENYLYEEIKVRLQGIPGIEAWINAANQQFSFGPFKTRPILVQTDRTAVRFQNRSPQLIKLGSDGHIKVLQHPNPNQHVPHTEPKEAGYWFGLENWLIGEIVSTRAALNAEAVFDVSCHFEQGDSCPRTGDPIGPGALPMHWTGKKDCGGNCK